MKKSFYSLLFVGLTLFAQDGIMSPRAVNNGNVNSAETTNTNLPNLPTGGSDTVVLNNNTAPLSTGIIQNSPHLNMPSIIKVSGTGEGVPPMNVISPAQARALARRAAIADAYRSLAEKMYGIRLSAKDRVRDLVAQRTEVRTAVYGIIRGASIDEEKWKDGLYQVVLVVNLDACMWSNYLSAPSFYRCGR